MWQSLRRGRAGVFSVRLRSVCTRKKTAQQLHYKWLAKTFVEHYRYEDPHVEHVAVYTHGDIYFVPNRAKDPTSHCAVAAQDIMPSVRPRLTGYMHSHPFDAPDKISADDYNKLPASKTGAVWRHASRWVDFYDYDGPIYSVRIK